MKIGKVTPVGSIRDGGLDGLLAASFADGSGRMDRMDGSKRLGKHTHTHTYTSPFLALVLVV
jgi:hypothetical protein